MCFIRPGPLRLHTASALCESVCRSGTALYCHYCKSCAAPKPSIAPERMPYNSASALDTAHVLCACPREHCAPMKENLSSTKALTSCFVVSPVAVNWNFHSFCMWIKTKLLIHLTRAKQVPASFFSHRIATVVGFLIDQKRVFTLC